MGRWSMQGATRQGDCAARRSFAASTQTPSIRLKGSSVDCTAGRKRSIILRGGGVLSELASIGRASTNRPRDWQIAADPRARPNQTQRVVTSAQAQAARVKSPSYFMKGFDSASPPTESPPPQESRRYPPPPHRLLLAHQRPVRNPEPLTEPPSATRPRVFNAANRCRRASSRMLWTTGSTASSLMRGLFW